MNFIARGKRGSRLRWLILEVCRQRATGFEFGALGTVGAVGVVAGELLLTEVNRPVAAVTLSSTPTSTLLMGESGATEQKADRGRGTYRSRRGCR